MSIEQEENGEAGGRPETSSDSPLVQRAVTRAQEGDPEGLHFLYARYAPDVLRCVDGFVNDDREAEDITQGVFAELVTAIDDYEQWELPFAEWILQIARSVALRH